MAEKSETKQPTHRAYSVIRREGQDDFWLNLGLVFPHKDGGGFNIMLQAFPLDGKIVCREITEDDNAGNAEAPVQTKRAARSRQRAVEDPWARRHDPQGSLVLQSRTRAAGRRQLSPFPFSNDASTRRSRSSFAKKFSTNA